MAKGIEWTPADDNTTNNRRSHAPTPTAPPLPNDHNSHHYNASHSATATPHPPSSSTQPLLAGDSTVSFLVNGTDTLTANREHIRQHSSVLLDIVNSSTPTADGQHRLPEIVDVALFGALLKFFDTRQVVCDDIDDALRQLECAKRYGCVRMVHACVQTADAWLTVANVVGVYKSLRFHVLHANVEKSKLQLAAMTADQAIEALMFNVLQFIDQNAEVVLQMDEIFDAALNFTDVDCILGRDTLMVSEVVIYNFLGRWSRTECQRRQWEITAENRRRILGPMIYIPRFFLMSAKEFDLACQRVEILSADEQRMVADWFASGGGKSSALNADQTAMMTRFRKERPKFARMPLHLSDRSCPKNYSPKMRKNERKLVDDGTSSWLYWFCGCYAFICD